MTENERMAMEFGRVTEVSIEEIEEILTGDDVHREALAHVYDFGCNAMMPEILQRVLQIESKLTSMLTLSCALIAFTSVGNEIWKQNSGALKGFLAFAVALVLFALVSCYLGLRIALAQWPSESDWFVRSRFNSPEGVLKTHLLALLDAHQRGARIAKRKATHAVRAQWALLLGSMIVGLICIIRIVAG
jgi:hypothetical protein